MKKIITALANPVLNERLKVLNKYEIMNKDIQYQEGVLEYLTENHSTDVLILSEILPGAMNKYDFLNSIFDISRRLKIIIILEKEDKEFKKFLNSNSVFNVFCDEYVEFEQIVDAIDNESSANNYNNIPKELLEEINNLKQVIENNKRNNIFEYFNKIKDKFSFTKDKKRNQLIKYKDKKNKEIFNFGGQIISILGVNGSRKIYIYSYFNKHFRKEI